MEQNSAAQTALDQMVGSDTGQLLKAAVPYLPHKTARICSIYAKIQELQNTLTLFSAGKPYGEMNAASTPVSPLEALSDIRRFCFGNSRRQLDSLINVLSMAEMIKVMNQP